MRRFWENLPLRLKVLAVVAVPAIPLVVSMLIALVSARRERDAEEWVAHTIEVKAQVADTLAVTADAEASVHVFLLTHEKEALTPFFQLGGAWPATITRLVDIVRDNPSQVERLKQIAALQGRNPLMSLVQYGLSHGDEPIPSALLEEHEQTLQAFRAVLADMQRVEDQLLQERLTAVRRARRRTVIVAMTGAGLGVLGSVMAAVFFSGGISRRIHRVRDNAERLSRGDELLPFTGERHDEVGALARSIREAAALLNAREHALNTHMQELAAVNQELEAFSYSVSHDLRAPLRHITGFAALLESTGGARLEDDDRRRLRTIAQAATRMGRLIDDLLAFSRMGRNALSKRRVRLDDVVREARKEVGANAAAATAEWNVAPLPDVDADPAMLHLVFVNLFENALKYARPGERPAIEVGSNRQPGETVVYVKDRGVGFDMQYAHKLFGVFQRLHSSDQFEGTGIGLANVRRIIHRHGGRVWAEGAVNGGATFYFSLPQEGAAA
jgi:signal transduction histidine kinase